jgi:hypothetical protein
VAAASASAPAPALAQFDPRKPDGVGILFMPFETDREADRSVVFLLEDYLQTWLPRKVRHPVISGNQALPAIPQGASACLADSLCVQMLGGQFNVSLVVRSTVSRAGSDLRLDAEWFATGNGLKLARESTSFPSGQEKAMVEAVASWFTKYFDASLRISPENRAGEGGVVGGGSDDRERLEDYQRARTKKVSSRREDFGESDERQLFDRDDPTADLRRALDDEDDPYPDRRSEDRDERAGRSNSSSSSSRSSGSRDSDELPPVDDEELEDLDDPNPSRSRSGASSSDSSSPARSSSSRSSSSSRDSRLVDEDLSSPSSSSRDEEDEDLDAPEPTRASARADRRRDADELDLDASDRRGRSTGTYDDAQRAGYGPREYRRFTRSGATFEEFQSRRWAYGGRFHLRVGGYYGFGSLWRRYATIVFVRVGGVKTDEYMWESLGWTWFNPGGGLGFGVSPVDLLEIEYEFSVMYGKQDLRREYDSHEIGTNYPALPESRASLHVLNDLRARFFILPRKRVKPNAGIGATILVMSGYKIPPEPPLDYSPRPAAAVVGLSPVAGVTVAATPFLSLYVDVVPTVYLTQGAAKYQDHQLFNGAIEAYLPAEKMQVPLSTIPMMARVAVGTMIMF